MIISHNTMDTKMYISRYILLFTVFISMEKVAALVVKKRLDKLNPAQNLEEINQQKRINIDDRSDDEIVTVTAKFWYVSDYSGKYREDFEYQNVDKNCVDDEKKDEHCDRIVTNATEHVLFGDNSCWSLSERDPNGKRTNWTKTLQEIDDCLGTPQIRAQDAVNKSLDYINMALANSEIPIRYVQWGSLQDIGQTEQQIGSGYTGVGGPVATRSNNDVFKSVKSLFGGGEAGRTRLFQTADVAVLLLNYAMKLDSSTEGKNEGQLMGQCRGRFYWPELEDDDSRFVVLSTVYGLEWLFAHEAGHCLGASTFGHMKPAGYKGNHTNFGYCPPEGEYGTIESMTPYCPSPPSGEYRKKEPYYSNPDVTFQGSPTGTESQNNAKTMKEKRFENAAAGTNCFDGNPDEAWMNGDDVSGKIGNNCPNGEASFEPPLSASLVNCEYSNWSQWSTCNKACGGGTQNRSREPTRQPWYGGIKCSEEDSNDEKVCNVDACPVCDEPKQLFASTFDCDASKDTGTPCTNLFDGDESTVWESGRNKITRNVDPKNYADDKYQMGRNTNIKMIFSKETIVTGVQIINKNDKKDSYENYKKMELQFSNTFVKEVELANGKQNDVLSLKYPIETSFVNLEGLSTWGHMPDQHWICNGIYPWCERTTGFRSGLSEIRLFGCAEGKVDDGVDGGWSQWGAWSECSSECGPGKKSRTRSCTSPKPSGSRPPCPGEDLEESGCEIGPCEGDICFEVSFTPDFWAYYNSWTIGPCSTGTVHKSRKTQKEECCLPSGQYTLECKDSKGNGWKGGHIMIDGKTYCESFKEGKLETHEILIGSNTNQEENDADEWVIGKHCNGQTLATVFVSELGKDLNTAKEECVEACDIRDDCKFANLYKGESCYLQATCGEMDDFFEYRVYIKQ